MPRRPVVARKMVVTQCKMLAVNKYTRTQQVMEDLFPRKYNSLEDLLYKARQKYEKYGVAIADIIEWKVCELKGHMDEAVYIENCTIDSLEVIETLKSDTRSLNTAHKVQERRN